MGGYDMAFVELWQACTVKEAIVLSMLSQGRHTLESTKSETCWPFNFERLEPH